MNCSCFPLNFNFVISNLSTLLPNGGQIILQEGLYQIHNKISIPSNIILNGSGKGLTTIQASNNFTDACLFFSSNSDNIQIKNMTIDGNYTNVISNTRGINLNIGKNIIIDNCEVINCNDISICFQEINNGIIKNCEIYDSGSYQPHGIAILAGSKFCKIVNNHIHDINGMGIVFIENGGNCTDCIVEENTTNNTLLEGCNIGKNQERISINNNNFSYSGDNGISVLGNDIIIKGNIVSYNNNNGIYLASNKNTIVDSNICKNNNLVNNGFSGIQISNWDSPNGCLNFIINSNICYDDQSIKTQQYGIQLTTLSNNYYIITSNNFLGNSSGGIQDLTTGTPTKQVANNLV